MTIQQNTRLYSQSKEELEQGVLRLKEASQKRIELRHANSIGEFPKTIIEYTVAPNHTRRLNNNNNNNIKSNTLKLTQNNN